ncbi:UNVERIFIED_ORG: hypothetical protein LHJ69_16035 [Shinella sp. XGS7]|nr:hypothetical protein [Shinella sp. XGS7]
MAKYQDLKKATIELLDYYAVKVDITPGYGVPKSNPKYSAKTKLATVGLNSYVRRAMLNATNDTMQAQFKSEWRSVGQSELEDADDIGSFIKLMCKHTSTEVPEGEPT